MKKITKQITPIADLLILVIGIGMVLAGVGYAVLQPIIAPLTTGTVGLVVGGAITIVELGRLNMLKI